MPNKNEQLADQAMEEIKEIERTPLVGQSEEAERIAEVVTRLVERTLSPNQQLTPSQ